LLPSPSPADTVPPYSSSLPPPYLAEASSKAPPYPPPAPTGLAARVLAFLEREDAGVKFRGQGLKDQAIEIHIGASARAPSARLPLARTCALTPSPSSSQRATFPTSLRRRRPVGAPSPSTCGSRAYGGPSRSTTCSATPSSSREATSSCATSCTARSRSPAVRPPLSLRLTQALEDSVDRTARALTPLARSPPIVRLLLDPRHLGLPLAPARPVPPPHQHDLHARVAPRTVPARARHGARARARPGHVPARRRPRARGEEGAVVGLEELGRAVLRRRRSGGAASRCCCGSCDRESGSFSLRRSSGDGKERSVRAC